MDDFLTKNLGVEERAAHKSYALHESAAALQGRALTAGMDAKEQLAKEHAEARNRARLAAHLSSTRRTGPPTRRTSTRCPRPRAASSAT